MSRTAEQILADVTASVGAARDKVRDKRRKRRTLADLCSLFENAWNRGQREKSKEVPPTRLVQRDRALLKSQIITPFRDTTIDIEDFAYWVALNWHAIGAQYFTKSKRYPELPAFRWLVKCLETYTLAYQNREYLDENASLSRTQMRKKVAAVEKIQESADRSIASMQSEVEDLRRQLAERDKDNARLREQLGEAEDDDPILAHAVRAAKRKVKIGSYDDEPSKPRRRRLRK